MSGGVPPSSRARTRAKIGTRKDVQRAASLYERFSGHEAEVLGKVKIRALPKVGVAIGHCLEIHYVTVRDGVQESYRHPFHRKDAPLLVVSPDGKQILLVGGRYTFTERGIVDATDKKR